MMTIIRSSGMWCYAVW